MTARNYSPVKVVAYYQARCTNCGKAWDDYGDITAWSDMDTPVNEVVDCHDWTALWERTGDLTTNGRPATELTELLCPTCQPSEDE